MMREATGQRSTPILHRVVNRGGHVYGIVGPYNEKIKTICKRIPGMHWSNQHRAWLGYLDAVSTVCDVAKSQGITIAPPAKPIINADTIAVSYEGLRDYQKTGVDFVVDHAQEGCILADDLGLGKTAQAIRSARAFKARTFVVCPNAVKLHWEDEFKKWWPDARVAVLDGMKPETMTPPPLTIHDYDVLIANFDIVRGWQGALQTWKPETGIIDELHYMMTSTSKRTEAVRSVFSNCRQRIGLTGTPKPSHVKNLWSAVETISPHRFGEKFFPFGLRYCAGRQEGIDLYEDGVKVTRNVWKWDGSSNEEELAKRLSFFMLRRLKSDVGLQLPRVNRQVLELEVKRKQTDHRSFLMSDRAFRKALDIAADQKIPQLIDLLVEWLAAGAKTVFWSYRKSVAQMVADSVKQKTKAKVAVITGETAIGQRKTIIASKPDLLCATMDSIGTGVSLAYAKRALFGELHYTPSTLIQAEGRLPRPDSTEEAIDVVYAVARGTADEIIKRIVLKKMAIDEKVIGRSTSKLFEDLDTAAKTSVAEKMRKLYESILKESDDE